jgi:regulator of protease activity HflC (stomatin/prohibitin superfamily)
MNVSSRKAETVSLIALILSLIFFGFTLFFGASVATLPMSVLSWQFLAAALVWLVLLIQFHQRTLAEQEKLDMSQLTKSESQDTIFSSGADRMAMMAVHQKRLVFLEKWIIPVSAIVIGIYEIAIGMWLFKVVTDPIKTAMWVYSEPLLSMFLMIIVSFVCFLFSRYATGMSLQTEWKPLRAGGSLLLLTALSSILLAIALAMAHFKYGQGLTVLAYVLPWLLIILGAETLLNCMLDIYRPRMAGQYNRASFDSRILGVFNEPGGILHTVAHTIDYQFGFQISQTWFYKLLEKAIIPLVLFALIALYLVSSIIVVGPGQAAVIEYYGQPVRDVGPGLHFKWPWPVEVAYLYPTKEIQQLSIGYLESEEDKQRTSYFWGEKHYEKEYNLLVAVDTFDDRDEQGAVPVSIVQASVPLQYRISDLRKFLYNHRQAREMLEAICYRELTRFAVSAKIEFNEPGVAMDHESLLGGGRLSAGEELKHRIQRAIDEFQTGNLDEPGLGLEIVFLGLQGVHPPAEVAKEYEQVVAAVQEKQAMVLNAQAQKNRILTEIGGSIAEVDALYALTSEYERSKATADEAQLQALNEALQTALSGVKGKIYSTLRKAEGDAFERINLAKGEGLRFGGQLQGYRASPEIFMKLQRLLMLEEALKDIRKFVVVAEKSDAEVYIVDLQEKLTTSIYDLDLGLEQP